MCAFSSRTSPTSSASPASRGDRPGRVEEALASGRIIDAILLLVLLEAVLFLRAGRGRILLPNLAAGACLLLALRAALTGAPMALLGLWLALAGVAHGLDVAGRWRAGRG